MLRQVALLTIVLIGCEAEPRALQWRLAFDPSALRDRAVLVEATISRGECGSDDLVFRTEVPVGADGTVAMRPPVLDAGRYALSARARDASCAWFASGCRAETFPPGADEPIVVVLEAITPEPGCPTGDAGPGDAAPPTDTGPPADAGPPIDAGPPPDGGPPVTIIESIATGYDSAYAITPAGELWAWGDNDQGDLGVGPVSDFEATPRRVGTATDWALVRGGENHACALKDDGQLWCWGDNSEGQLGIGAGASILIAPARITDRTFEDFALGRFHTCAIETGGALWCWGSNDFGELGIGTSGTLTDLFEPTPVDTSARYREIGAGGDHTCGIRTDGSLWCAGNNLEGALGVGDTVDREVFTQVGTGVDWTRVEGGKVHTCGLRNTSELWCWGHNAFGQLGLGDETMRTTPVRVGSHEWGYALGGRFFTCGRRDSMAFCWGDNDGGQLGVPSATLERTSSPRVVAGVGATRIAAGGFFACAIDAAGVAQCWGENSSGQIATGSATPFEAPRPIVLP